MKRFKNGWFIGVSAVCLFNGLPVLAQSLPGQECDGQTCGLYLQSTQALQPQESPGKSGTPLQPAARGLSGEDGAALQLTADDLAKQLAGGEAAPRQAANGLGWVVPGAGLLGFVLLVYALDGLFLSSRLRGRLVRLGKGLRPERGSASQKDS